MIRDEADAKSKKSPVFKALASYRVLQKDRQSKHKDSGPLGSNAIKLLNDHFLKNVYVTHLTRESSEKSIKIN